MKNELAHRSNWWLKAIRSNRYCWENSCGSRIWSLLKISFGTRGRLARERSQRPNFGQRMLAEHSLNSRLPDLISTNLLSASDLLARLYGRDSAIQFWGWSCLTFCCRGLGLDIFNINYDNFVSPGCLQFRYFAVPTRYKIQFMYSRIMREDANEGNCNQRHSVQRLVDWEDVQPMISIPISIFMIV